MKLECVEESFGLVVTVPEARIDASVAIQFKDQMRDVTQDVQGRIVLDMGNVEFVDSSGLGAIVAALKHLQDGQQMELAALSPTVAKVFRLTRMDKVFPIHASVADVAGAMANAS
ncbi:MAG: STAS domain-containing protein [Pseudomonadota bacterium]